MTDFDYETLFKDRDFLCKEMLWDLAIETTITGVSLNNKVPDPKSGRPTSKHVVHYADLPLPHVLNKTNTRFLVRACGGRNTSAWTGRRVTVYVDRNRKRNNPDGTDGMIAIMIGNDYSGEHGPVEQASRVTGRSLSQPAKAAPPSPPSFSAKAKWPRAKAWNGKPLADAPRNVLGEYLAVLVAIDPGGNAKAKAALDRRIGDVEAAINALPVDQDEDDAPPDVAEAGGAWDDGPPEELA